MALCARHRLCWRRRPAGVRADVERAIAMDRWKYFDITHRDHIVCNPLSVAKLEELVGLLALPAGARVLDIACGKGELLLRLVERFGAQGVGVDRSPYAVRDARALAATWVPEADLTFQEGDGAECAAAPRSVDLAMCVGASWVFGGHRGTLRALARWARPGGQVLVGEPYWRQIPEPAYLAASGLDTESFATHADNVAVGLEEGLTPLYTLVSNEDDWDRYEALQWRAAERYALAHPEDPDVPELLATVRHARDTYLRWGRTTLGWALYLFIAPAGNTTLHT
jgi:SAM-dependent methyltransferase